MSLKKIIMTLSRKLGLMHQVDRFYYWVNKSRFARKNEKFLRLHSDKPMPPAYMLYEAYRLDYSVYYEDGRNTAQWIVGLFLEFTSINHKTILEWGCGPARIIRHMPELMPSGKIYGSDYNVQTIEWCRINIQGIDFSINQLEPPLTYSSNSFDLVYAISVFTHLSIPSHFKWLDEICRVTKPGGLFLFTTQGDAFQDKLTTQEKKVFSTGKIVERANVKEGHRSYSAFQPPAFINNLLAGKWKLIHYIPGEIHNWGPGQDTWIIQKQRADHTN